MHYPREPREFTDMSDDSFNNGFWSDERRGPYYGRVSFNDDEVDEEPEGFEGSFNDENEGI
jgi:hypothetical protein